MEKRFILEYFHVFLQMALNDKESSEIKKMKPHEMMSMSNAEFVSKLMCRFYFKLCNAIFKVLSFILYQFS